MSVDLSHYHGWEGPRISPWRAALSLCGVALRQVLRRKGYWVILFLGLINFFLFFAVIYFTTQLQVPDRMRANILVGFGFQAVPDAQGSNGYVTFMDRQSMIVMLLLAFSGSLVVGADFRDGVLPFYLSRGITCGQYVAGKVLALAALIWLLTAAPAVALFIEYGCFTSSFDYWIDHASTLVGVAGYGLVMGTALGTLLAAVSAGLQRMAPVAIVWCSLFLLLGLVSRMMLQFTDDQRWLLLNYWVDLKIVSMHLFGDLGKHPHRELLGSAATVVSGVTLLSLFYLWLRVRKVENMG